MALASLLLAYDSERSSAHFVDSGVENSWIRIQNVGVQPATAEVLNLLEHRLFWGSVAAAVVIMATGAGRTFTYVDNWYGEDAEARRRRALIVKHVVLFSAYGMGYFWVWGKVFH